MLTPYDLHHGLAETRREERAAVLREAWAKHPERFPHGCPVPPALPTAVWINKPSLAAAPAKPADQRASKGAQAGEAIVAAPIVNAAGEDGLTTQGGAH